MANYEIHERIYQTIRAEGGQGWGGAARLERAPILLERLFSLPAVPVEGALLELGCGEGNYARLLHERGYQVTGVDVAPTAIAWAQEKAAALGYAIQFLQADLSRPWTLAEGQFDLVVDGNCLHCIIGGDRQPFLANVWVALRPAGLFFVSSLCSQSEQDRLTYRDDQPYRQIMAPAHLLAELKAAGFGIEQSVIHPGEQSNHITIHARKLV